MRGATLSILGLYQFDDHILKGMQLPAGMTHDILDPELLSECAELEILYPDPDVFKTILAAWSAHRVFTWDRMYKAAQLVYDPIENYDRREDWTDSGSGNESSSDITGNSGSSQTDSYTAGYNPNALGDPPGMVKQNQENTTGSTSGSVSHSGNNSGSATHSGRVHGNIGVTTSQQMLEQELAVADKLDVYRFIIQDFKARFCIPLY